MDLVRLEGPRGGEGGIFPCRAWQGEGRRGWEGLIGLQVGHFLESLVRWGMRTEQIKLSVMGANEIWKEGQVYNGECCPEG
jgi:hypothetical protein